MSIAVFVNPHSRANRRDPGLGGRFAAILGDEGQVITPTTLDGLGTAARDLAARPPATIAVHGGDGTLHKTLTALLGAFAGSPLPPLAILPGGTMNVVAASLGLSAPPEALLAQLVEDQQAGRAPSTVSRHCLRVGGAFGFVFGNGMMANFLEVYYAKPGYGPGRALWILLRTVLSALIGGCYARAIFRRFAGRVLVDGQALPWRTFTGLGAATVREVGLGFKLNHRADDDPQRMGVLAIHAGPLALAPELLAVYQGRGISPARAWSAVASRLLIEPDEAQTTYTIDGDLYPARGAIEIAMGPELTFVRPR